MITILLQNWVYTLAALAALALLIVLAGFVIIDERQVGIVVKKFSKTSLPDGHLFESDRAQSL
jgi:hypothetical protein